MTPSVHAFGAPVAGGVPASMLAAEMMQGVTCAVRLIDRRTGRPHRLGGVPFTVFTKTPQETAAELLAGRNPAHWETRIEPLITEQR